MGWGRPPASTMARDRKCILCETVHASKQEMEEHLRSMLHHRELEKLKGRDCGHECRPCKVKVASLTDYAGHISSPSHKQKVEAADQKQAGNDWDEDYFDQALVDLIEKRKEQIRKEKEAAAAKLTKEEEERKRQEVFQQRLQEAKEQYRRGYNWQQPSPGYGAAGNHGNWYGGKKDNYKSGEWQHNNQGRSATWHAQEPPNLHKWASEEFSGGRNQEWRGNRTWGQGSYPQSSHSRLPWLSSGGSSNGLYGRNNISQFAPRGPTQNFSGPPSKCPPLPNFLTQPYSHFSNGDSDYRIHQGAGHQNGEGPSVETDHNGCKSSMAFGSNPKLDKTCRWSPYPVAKAPEAGPCHDANQYPSEKHPKVSIAQRPDRDPEPSGFSRQSGPEQKPAPPHSSRQSVEDIRKNPWHPQTRPRDRSSSSQVDGTAVTPSPGQKGNEATPQMEQRISLVPDLSSGAKLSKASNQAQVNPTRKHSSIKSPLHGPLKPSSSERQLLKTLRKARQLMSDKKSSPDCPNTTQEEQRRDQSHIGGNKENSCWPSADKRTLSDPNGLEKRTAPPSDSSQNLQSLQVTTSTSEPAAAAASDGVTNRKRVEKQHRPASPDEAMQVGEGGQSSESDASKTSEALASSGVSWLELPPGLKRDLTKHISSKSKAIGHEPNLNIARRVRNLSESRRSDSEKDSGIKPTVRQLISSSGSRRNVNWEQVYQEVRKKQDKGKGMPRFGIEMVPCEQEYHSQGEDDIPLLEGFQWDSLMEASSQSTSRKRSLSESSVAPVSSHSLFTPSVCKEEERASTCSSNHGPAGGNEAAPQVPGQSDAQKQKLLSSTVRALQRSDSLLGDSSSGAEQHDGQGAGKRRRAALDLASTESSCVEHGSKRRKVKSKKERLQIDQLLAVSLREDELSRSLQTVDGSLVQARAALEAAYVEVQRLMVVKQQMTGEMSTLRNKRIELLRGMQNEEDETLPVKPKEEKVDTVGAEASVTVPTATVAAAPSRAAECASPPSSSAPSFTPVVVKQEPQSPIYVSSEPYPPDGFSHCAHSTTLELPAGPAPPAPAPDPCHGDAADSKEALRELIETMQTAVHAGNNGSSFPPDTKPPVKLPPPSRRGSEGPDGRDVFQPPAPPLNPPLSPSDLRGGKRVRKLKKRKELKKAQGAEQPETSDTEGDEETSRPRWLRLRRRPSGGSQVSTSSLPTEEGEGGPRVPGQLQLTVKLEKLDLKKYSQSLEPAEAVRNQDSEENMEVTESSQQPHQDQQVLDSVKPEPQSLACNEVSSTSDMDLCRSSESDLPFAITYPKNSSDASSDHGEDDTPSQGPFEGHQEAVNAMQIHDGQLYTCSGDRTVKVFDLVSRRCVGVFEGHSSKVSCLLVSAAPCLHHRLYSGSSDQTIRCYNLKTRELEQQFSLSDRVLCLHSRWRTLFAGLANGTVVTFNLKTNKQVEVFECHGLRAVSCLASSQEGVRRILLVGSYDNTISVRDAKNGLLLRLLEGHTKTVLCMKVVNDLVFSGSSDQCVHAHNIHTGELVRVYKGHSHAVTVVSILGKVMVTACLDKLVRVFDLESHEQLQIYGGHKDMLMCMTIHKNMIYSGCYDGSVQAVKLNLMQSYRCQWHGCPQVFGLADHLQRHLLTDHAGSKAAVFKCRWKNCEEFFGSRNSSKQGALLHMQKHAAEGTEVEP